MTDTVSLAQCDEAVEHRSLGANQLHLSAYRSTTLTRFTSWRRSKFPGESSRAPDAEPTMNRVSLPEPARSVIEIRPGRPQGRLIETVSGCHLR